MSQEAEEEEKQFRLRLSPALYAKIEALAKRNHRSVNGQMLAYLEECASRDMPTEDRSRKGRPRGGLRNDEASPRPPALAALAGVT